MDAAERWHIDMPPGEVPGISNGDAAIQALSDVRLVRALLDQAEMIAVKTARQGGKTWAEVATTLGLSRQDAMDRWQEFDAGGE